MKKNLHQLSCSIWIDEQKAMIIREEPQGVRQYETVNNPNAGRARMAGEHPAKPSYLGETMNREKHDQNRKNNELERFVKEVASHIRYATTVDIMGPGQTRHKLQREIEANKDQHNIVITNTPCRKLNREDFEARAMKK